MTAVPTAIATLRVDLGLAAQAPHRPVRADFPHTVLQDARFAELERLSAPIPLTGIGTSMDPPRIQAQAVHPGARLPSAGSLRARFARHQRYYARTKTAACPSPAFRYPSRSAYCASALVSRKDRRLSQVAGEPSRAFALLSDPAGADRPAITDGPCRSPRFDRESHPGTRVYRGSITRLQHPPPTLPDVIALHGQGWLPAAWRAVPGGGRLGACTRWVPLANFSSRLFACHLLSRRPWPGASHTHSTP